MWNGDDVPGPGAYSPSDSARSTPASPKRREVGTFGYAKDRGAFIQPSETPGPAAYFLEDDDSATLSERLEIGLGGTAKSTVSTRPLSPTKYGMGGFTFGTSPPKQGTMFISRMHAHAESYGKHGPGPGAYNSISADKFRNASKKYSGN